MSTPFGIYLSILSPIVRLVLAVAIVGVLATALGYNPIEIIGRAFIRSVLPF